LRLARLVPPGKTQETVAWADLSSGTPPFADRGQLRHARYDVSTPGIMIE
jgi:hypothetical protein